MNQLGNLTMETTIVRNDTNFVATSVGDEIVIMNMKTGDFIGLDKISSIVWQLLENPIIVKEIIDSLMEKYNVSREQCEEDILKLLDNMQQNGLLNMV